MIKGLTLQLNTAGRIKIGKKGKEVTSGGGKTFRMPEKLDHFQITTTEKNEEGDYIVDTALENKIKDAGTGIVNESGNLTGLPIRLLYNDIDLNFETKLASYVKGKLSCTGDGEIATKRIDDFTKSHPCPCNRLEFDYTGNDKCKYNGLLNLIIDEAGLFGQAHNFRTTSINSVKGILGGLELIRTATNGRIAGLPLMLTLNAKSTQTPQGVNTTVYVVSVCYRGSMSDLRTETLQLMSEEHQYMIGMDQLEAEARKALPQKTVTTEIEDLEVVEEFYPDALPLPGASNTVKYETVQKSVDPEPAIEPEKELESITVSTASKTHVTAHPPAEEDTDAPGEFPAGSYKAVYEKLLAETDYEKAISLVKRLTKGNLVYFLTQEHPSISISDGTKKPELIEICETALSGLVGEVGVTDTEDHSILGTVKSHPAYVAINSIPNTDRVNFLNAVGEFFKPLPIDKTATRDILLTKVVTELEQRIKADMKPQAIIVEKKEQSEVKEPKVENIVQEETINTEHPVKSTEPEKSPLQAWDDSGLIEKPQLIQIVKLKKDLEMLGILDVTDSGKWQDKYISCFLDADGNPHSSAVKFSKMQGNTLIKMLVDADCVLF